MSDSLEASDQSTENLSDDTKVVYRNKLEESDTESESGQGSTGIENKKMSAEEKNLDPMNELQKEGTEGTKGKGKEQIPQRTKDEDNVAEAIEPGSQKKVDSEKDIASLSPGDNAIAEAASEEDDESESGTGSGGVENPKTSAEEKKLEPTTELQKEETQRTKKEGMPQKTRHEDNVAMAIESGSQKKVDSEKDIASLSPGDNAIAEAASEEDDESESGTGSGGVENPNTSAEEKNLEPMTELQKEGTEGTKGKGIEQIPQRTKDEDNVAEAIEPGSQKKVDSEKDTTSRSAGDDDMQESASEDDEDDDLMKFTIILRRKHTITAPQGVEALKWRFLFDCPYTQKEICEDPVMVGASLEYKKGTSPLINQKNSERTFKNGLKKLLERHAEQVQIHHTSISCVTVEKLLGALQLEELFKTKMVIAYKIETNLYTCCKKEHMEKAVKHVIESENYVQRLISKTEIIPMKDIPLQLIKRWLEVHMSPDTSNIQYEFREDQKCLHIKGLESEIVKEKDKLQNLLAGIAHTTYKPLICVAHLSVFEEPWFVKYVEEILLEQKLVCTWETNKTECCIVVTAFDDETCQKACKVMDTACERDSITLQVDATTRILPSISWEGEVSSICTELGGKMKIWLDKAQNILEYIHTHDIREMVRHKVQSLVNSWDIEKYLSVERQVVEQIEKKQQKLKKLNESYSVVISVSRNSDKMGFLIIGKDTNIQPALKELEKECAMILKSNFKPGASEQSFENCEVICVPQTEEMELIMLKDMCICHCNRSELKDRETNAEIVEITPEFSLKVLRSDEVKADMVLPTDKSKRPVIFNCSKWNEGEVKEKTIFDSVICHLFEFLSTLGAEALLEIKYKIIGNWPLEKFVKQLLVSFQTYLKVSKGKIMSRLFLLMKDQEVYDIVKQAVYDVYDCGKSHSEDKRKSSPKEEPTEMSKASQISCVTKVLKLFIVTGQLAQRKEDVLVNTAHPELKLQYGFVSKSILEAAGPEIEAECRQKYPNGIKPGQVAVTKAYGLKESKLIFHGTFETWNPIKGKTLKHTLKQFVTQCLQRADKAKMNSIAFPAIGTGNLSYPSNVVAECMIGAVEEYNQRKQANLEGVYFVIYYKDKNTLAAFDERMKIYELKIEGSPVDVMSTIPSSDVKPKRKPAPSVPDQQTHPKKETTEPGSSKEERLFDIGDEFNESQCLINSEVRISTEIMAAIDQGKLEHIQKQFRVTIDFDTSCIKGQLVDLQRLEKYLQDLIRDHLNDKSVSDADEMEEEQEEGKSGKEYHNFKQRLAADNVSQVKYDAFRYFYNDWYISALEKEIELYFDQENGQLYVQGWNEDDVDHAVSEIRNAEIAKYQESDVSITKEQFEDAQMFVVKMKSCSPHKKVFCYIDEKDPLTVHFVAKTYMDIDSAKHKMNIDIGTVKITNRQNRSYSPVADKNYILQLTSVPSKMATQDPSRKSFTTAEGIKVFVYNCSILQVDANVIVNAANEDLKHIGGVAKVIADAAGREFTEECQRYIKKNGNLTVGATCITQGGKLKYPFVIHTVGPQFDKYSKTTEGLQKCMTDLWKAVIGCFFKAEELNVQSVALPAVSSGMLWVPMEICASQYLKAVMAYSKSTQGTGSLKEIHFIDVKEEILNLIELVFSATLENNQAASKKFNDRLQKVLSRYDEPSTRQTFASVASFKNIGHSSENQGSIFCFTNTLNVIIYYGDITESKCITIVSSEDKDLKSQGGVSTAIRQKAGKDFEKHIVKFRGKVYEVGDVMEVDAGNLKCKKVLCCIVPKWTSSMSDEEYKRHLGQCFRSILEKATKYKSVAIPLIGIGFKDSSIEICGRVLLDCLLQFSKALREKDSVREVHIVSLHERAITCVKRIFMEQLDVKRIKPGHMGVVSATASGGNDQPSPNSHPQSLASYNTEPNLLPRAKTMNRSGDDKHDQCAICLDKYNDPVKMNKCGHLFCKGCIDTHLKNKPVCPVCGTRYGVITGNQPKGTMSEFIYKYHHLNGYDGCGMIEITYDIPDGIQGEDHPKPGKQFFGLTRKAYLPNNKKGQKVLHLLHLAFDRRLIFTIGRSVTTGKDDMVTWNDIHHKTSKSGGSQKYGYPDPKYLDRVLDELATKGVTEESEHQDPANLNAYYKLPSISGTIV